MSENVKIAEKGLAEVRQYLKNQGYERIEKSKSKDHDLDAWKNVLRAMIISPHLRQLQSPRENQ